MEQLLRNKTMSLVRVCWRNQKVEESTWELKNTMQESIHNCFPDRFRDGIPLRGENVIPLECALLKIILKPLMNSKYQ